MTFCNVENLFLNIHGIMIKEKNLVKALSVLCYNCEFQHTAEHLVKTLSDYLVFFARTITTMLHGTISKYKVTNKTTESLIFSQIIWYCGLRNVVFI